MLKNIGKNTKITNVIQGVIITFSFLPKITSQAKKHENITHNEEKNHSIETNAEMTHLIEL